MPLGFTSNLDSLLFSGDNCDAWSHQGFEWLKDRVPEGIEEIREYLKNIVYIGLRDIDDLEELLLDGKFQSNRGHPIKWYSSDDVVRLGIETVMLETAEYLDKQGVEEVFCSFDIDAISPTWCPATGTDVDGGLTFYDALYIPWFLKADGRLVGMDNVELNPTITGKTYGTDLTVQVSNLLSFSGLGDQLTFKQFKESYQLAHQYYSRCVRDVTLEYEQMGIALPPNHKKLTAIALAQHLESMQIRRIQSDPNMELKQAGDLRSSWRSIAKHQEKEIRKLVGDIFDQLNTVTNDVFRDLVFWLLGIRAEADSSANLGELRAKVEESLYKSLSEVWETTGTKPAIQIRLERALWLCKPEVQEVFLELGDSDTEVDYITFERWQAKVNPTAKTKDIMLAFVNVAGESNTACWKKLVEHILHDTSTHELGGTVSIYVTMERNMRALFREFGEAMTLSIDEYQKMIKSAWKVRHTNEYDELFRYLSEHVPEENLDVVSYKSFREWVLYPDGGFNKLRRCMVAHITTFNIHRRMGGGHLM